VQFQLFTDMPFKVTLPVGIAIIAVLLALLLGFTFFSYRKNRQRLRKGWFYLLLTLRCMAAVLLLFALLNPVVATSSKRSKGAVIVMVDNSRSMQTRDSPETQGLKRIQTALGLLFGKDGLVEQLRESFDILSYEFGKGVKRLGRRRPLRKPGETTDFFEALTFVKALGRARGASAVVALSDGQNNVRSEEQLLETRIGAPIFCLGIGKKESDAGSRPDIELSQILSKRIMMQNTTHSLDLSLRKANVPSMKLKLEITEADSPLSEQTVSLDARDGRQHVSVQFVPKETGLHRFKLSAPPLPNELVSGNNSRFFTANVINPRLKVFYFEGRPRWEFKFIRRALETSPDIHLFSMVRTAADSFYVQGQTDELPLLKGFPSSLESLLKFDVLILGSGGREIVTPANISNIVKSVDNGKGLIVLGSADLASFAGTELERVLPAPPRPAQARLAAPFYLRLTTQGRTHPGTKILEGLFAKDNRLSRFKSRCVLGKKKQGAIALARAGSEDVILVQPYGKGRVFLFAPDSSWEWYLALERSGYGSAYSRFWQEAAGWASGYQTADEDKAFPIIIYTDKDYYDVGEQVAVEMETSVPLSDIDLSWDINDQSRPQAGKELQLTQAADQTGHYFGKLYPEEIGEYQVQVSYKNEKRTLWFTIGDPLAESTRIQLNDSLLKKIALSSGGSYFDLTQTKDLLRTLRSLAVVRPATRKETNIWDSPYPFILFVALCALEWFFRRRKQLI